MRHPGRRIRHNDAYDPWATKIDLRVQCAVCNFGGIDPERTQEPDRAPIRLETSGTRYEIGFDALDGDPPDKVTESFIPAYSACPLCGSPRWRDGFAPVIRR